MWLDATIFVVRQIPDIVFKKIFWSVKTEYVYNYVIGENNFKAFVFSSKKDSPVVNDVYGFLIEYWKYNNKQIDYFLTAHIFYFLYKNKSYFRRIVDDIEYSNPLIYELMPMFKYDKENYESLTKETVFFKCKLEEI